MPHWRLGLGRLEEVVPLGETREPVPVRDLLLCMA